MAFSGTGGFNMGSTSGTEVPANVIRVALPFDVSYHNLMGADGALLARRIVLTQKVKDDHDALCQYLLVLGFVTEDKYVVVSDMDGSYSIIDSEDDQIKFRIVPATQGMVQ